MAEIRLDSFQRKVYTQKVLRDTCLIVKAVAGSGKSTTMVSKAYRFVKIGFKPENILLTTFSNKSAKDLRSKFRYTFSKKVKGTPMMTTLHSFGIEILKTYFKIKTPIILTEWKAMMIIRDVCSNMGLFWDKDTGKRWSKKEQNAFTRQVYDALDYLKSNMIIQNIEDITTGKVLINEYKDKSQWFSSELFAQIVVQYENIKRQRGMYDYNDLIFRVYYELLKQPKVLTRVRNQYRVCIVDEAQDLDSSQWALILIISKGQRLICVGDVMQNIYNFRYSVPHYFSKTFLQKHFTKVIELSLENNYRSTKNIVDIGNSVRFLGKDNLLSKAFRPEVQGSVRFIKVKTNIQEGKAISNEIAKALSQGYELGDITVICRSNMYIKSIVEPALVSSKIPYHLLSRQIGKKLTDKPANQIYFNILSLLINPNDIMSLADLSEFVIGCGEKFSAQFSTAILRTGDIRYVDMGQANKKKLDNVKHLYSEIQKLKRSIKSVRLLPKMLDSIGYIVAMYLKPDLVSNKERETIDQVISNWVNYYKQEGITDLWENLNQVLFEVNSFDDSQEMNKVQVGTVHCISWNTTVKVKYEKIVEVITIRKLLELYKKTPNINIDTPDGWVALKCIIDNGTVPLYRVTFSNNYTLECTTEHRLDTEIGMLPLKEAKSYPILTDKGYSRIKDIQFLGNHPVCDIEVDHPLHRFYGNGISIHNSQKGLEQKVSIVSGFVGYKQKPDIDNDAINVLYVQLSRAMDKLIVITSEDYVLKDGTKVKGAMLNQMRLLISLLKGE